MPPTPLRQPRARRALFVGVAGTVALTALVVPGLVGQDGGRTVEATAAPASAESPTTTEATTPKVTLNGNQAEQEGQHSPEELRTLRMIATYTSASPEERATLENYFSPPPAPQPEPQAPAPKPAPAARQAASAPAVASGTVWDRLASCEAGNNWATHTASGFSGGLQFADSTWRAYGGTAYAPRAWQASRSQQIAVAEKVLASAGWKAWPACSRKLGLR